MNTYNFKKLNIFKICLNGVNLIESSAGTGKTFTIVLLYLRLLLGVGRKKHYKKKLLVQQILIVTFTNAAKEELYIRIKNGIQNLYLACINNATKDPILKSFLKEIHNIKEATDILYNAQNNINNCAIYTIHGFCQNILELHTFNYNITFKDTIIENEDDLYLQATQDFWRYYFYNLPENISKIIYQDYSSPDYLLKKIKRLCYIKSENFTKKLIKNTRLIKNHEKNIKKINNFKKIWLKNNKKLLIQINELKINKKIYNVFNISRWINNITIWAESETKDYIMPDSLRYFSQTNIKKNIKNNIILNNIIFKETEKILNNNFSLKKIIIQDAIQNINYFLLKEKKTQSLLGFNDLLSILLKIIKKEKFLQNLIREKYPAAFIDEFQDTNIEQYKIFDLLYKKNKKIALFLIGDPKQAIYSFRGADIFSYLYAKSKIKKCYFLDTNWRSSQKICHAINFLFSQHNNPFIFQNIQFQPIKPSCQNFNIDFIINGISQIPISFFLQDKKEVYIDEYQIWIAKQCAKEISYWLSSSKLGKTKIITKKGEKNLTANDIAVLVRNQKEACLIQKELQKLNITSIYSSNKTSIFHIFDAQELLWILESILEPDNQKLLKQSISTHILKNISSIMIKKSTNRQSYFLIEKLYEYYNMWEKIGIFQMIKTMILEYQITSSIIEIHKNYEKNLNFLHLAELLEEQFQFFDKKTSLIYWFQKKITNKNKPTCNEYIRSINKSESIKIITIHKSKGLEYPIVWIPFSVDFYQSKDFFYHDEKTYKIFFDREENKKSLKKSDEERLAEDIRFLYVALTRSIVHCSIGIACLLKNKKNKNYSDIHKSALGYIIQNGKIMNYDNLFKQLNILSGNKYIEIKHNSNNKTSSIYKKSIYLISKSITLKKNINKIDTITSFTQLQKENKCLIKETFLEDSLNINKKKKSKKLTIHTFPQGKKTGLMMHYILKNLCYLKNKNTDWFSKILDKYDFSLQWIPVLTSWIKNIITTSIHNEKIVLSKINKNRFLTELEFFLPIKNTLYSKELNIIMQSFDLISNTSPKLFFNPVKGTLTGFIDLVFFWKKKYYILDYKSNYLGIDNSFYSDQNIKKEMIKKRYDLQYQIYTIAIHKYLQKKVKNYNYQNDFGGVFYIFLRAISDNMKNNGIFYTFPNYTLIEKIIFLIS
ncbi:exodeoxyribonuclease V subunit beta [Buchnera aphidicola]|uniref:RecBCD enzyme subunit RecB n=1 Tax=Buchnera aphidicola (Artemisaphis artemisicola) TaxID=1241836 RepID=A0A4D6XTG4_9GAMM|nr:exodeoxyribonuclease V subunit beta [Buchnera aphidicola]QCI16115.1 exodeoxyribonuclease V subunit beta [Buchnera aphidicola (Artemisaphis artemisicola)]